ncbi:MAG: hypothetical protein COB17_01165 [Sulfurimonas sp.]|nr:MAG: hypothetical protein COB17_01165 [Sulfurimonas sp.]
MYTAAIITFLIVFTLVMIGLYLAGRQESVEKILDALIVDINTYSNEVNSHLKETIASARDSLDRFDKLQNLSEKEFLREEKVIKDLIAELSTVKAGLVEA